MTGASQGAKTVNDAVLESVKQIATAASDGSKEHAHPLQGWQVLHLSGHDHAEAVRAEWRELGLGGRAKTLDFTPDMADVWAVADLAVSRSGASSCAELLACGVPSILFPYPFHKDKHQTVNAKVLESAGAATVLDDTKDRKTNAAQLRPALEALLYDAAHRKRMSESARHAAKPDAARAVAERLAAMID